MVGNSNKWIPEMTSLFWTSISQGHHFDVSNPFDSESAADLSKISLIRACYVDTWKANVHFILKQSTFAMISHINKPSMVVYGQVF